MADPPAPLGPQDNLINVGFGTLNDVTKPIGGNRERQSSEHSFMDAVSSVAQNQYDVNAFANTGPYKAIVLRIETPMGASEIPEAGSWLSALFTSGQPLLPAPPVLVRVKARIPEVHAALPVPTGRGDVEGDHQKIIDMYPTFVAQTTAIMPPEVGEIIYVDFGNKNKWTDPIIVQNLISKDPNAGGAGGAGACGAFTGGGGGGLSPPTGDALPGSNKAAVNSGLPLLPRKAASVESGEYKFLKGEKGAYINNGANWEKAIKAAKIAGKFWLGYLDGRGEDDKHKSEDKLPDTIIFVPNVTDVSFKEAKVEVIVYLHDFNEYSLQSFTEIANTIKKMAVAGRNFVLVMPELPWSSNTETPNGRTGEEMSNYNTWWDSVLKTLKEITGAAFDDGSKNLYVSVMAKEAGAFIIRNAITGVGSEFHGSGPMDAGRVIMSLQSGTAEELVDEVAGTGGPDVEKTELAFLCEATAAAEIKGEVEDLKKDAGAEHPHNVILQEFKDKVTASALITWINIDKAKAKEEKEIAAKKEADKEPQTPSDAAKEDMAPVSEKKDADPPPPTQPDAQAPPPKDPPTPPSETPKKSATDPKDSPKLSPAVPYEENRVRIKHFGSLVGEAADKLLVEVPPEWNQEGKSIQKLHVLAMARVLALVKAAKAAGHELRVNSAWREHKWKSYESYKAKVTAEYGGGPEGWEKGKKARAFNSPHETGLATDWGSKETSGLHPKTKTIDTQLKTPAFAWLKENAHLFGLTPYKYEPWHWEVKLTKEAYITGKEFVNEAEAPASYAVRVDSLGSTDAQLPSGPGSGGTGGGGGGGGGGGAACRKRSGGGGGGPYPSSGPGIAFDNVGSPGKVKIIPGPAMPARRHAAGKSWPMRKEQLKLYVIHETAGWPTATGAQYAKKMGLNNPKSRYHADADLRQPAWCMDWKAAGHKKKPKICNSKANSFVTYWTAHNGEIIQTGPFNSLCWSAGPVNSWAQGNEIGNKVRTKNVRGDKSVIKGNHVLIRDDNLGHVRVLSGYEGGSDSRGGPNEAYMLNSLAQVEAVWNHYVWISKGADGIDGSDVINMPIAFPAVMSDSYFLWGRVASGTKDYGGWWKSQLGNDSWPGGISAHIRWAHGDGAFGEFYCLARAKGFSSKDAFYCGVGALCSMGGKGKGHAPGGKKSTRHPDKEYEQMGKDIMRDAPLTAPWGSFTPDSYWGW